MSEFTVAADRSELKSRRRSWGRAGSALGLMALAVVAGCSSTAKPVAANAPKASHASTGIVPVRPRPGPAALLPGSHHREIEQFGANTFADYEHAADMGPSLPLGAAVSVDCVAAGPVAAAPSAEDRKTHSDEWYHLTLPPKGDHREYFDPAGLAGFYVAANTFENNDISGPLNTQPPLDLNVPHCP